MSPEVRPSPLRRLWRQLKGLLLTTLAVLIIGLAAVVGLGRLLIPYADQARPWLAERLSERIGQPVSLERLEAQWPRLTPQLGLVGLKVGPVDAPLLVIDDARLEIHLPDLFNEDRNALQLIVLGLDLLVVEDADGRWGLELAGGAELPERGGREAGLMGDLRIRDARVRVRPKTRAELEGRLVEGNLRRRGERSRIDGRLALAGGLGGQLDFALLLSQYEGRWQAARGWLSGDELAFLDSLGGLPTAELRLSLEAWLDWQAESGARLDAELRIDGLPEAQPPLMAELLLARDRHQTVVELRHLHRAGEPAGAMASGLALARADDRWALAADEIKLDLLWALAAPWLRDVDGMPDRVDGSIQGLEAGWRAGLGLHALAGTLTNLGVAGPGRWPIISGLDLVLGLDGDRPVLSPGGQPAIAWPDLVSGSARFDRLGGQILVSPDALELRQLAIEADFVAAEANGWVYLARPRPFLDFVIEAERLGPLDPRPFLPPRYVPPAAMTWMEQALSWVDHAEGMVLLHMRAGKRAAEISPGDFEAEAVFEGLALDYWPEWPAARVELGRAHFLARSLSGEVQSGLLGELPVSASRVQIEDLIQPALLLELESRDQDAADVATLLRRLPVPVWERILAPQEWSGPTTIGTRLLLPFQQMDSWSLDGEAALDGVAFALPAAGLRLDGLAGRARFDREGVRSEDLGLRVDEQWHDIRLSAGFSEPAWLRLETEISPALPWAGHPALASLLDRVEGRSPIRLSLEGAGDDGLLLELESELTGVALNWPAPLDKPRSARWPLAVSLRIGDAGWQGRLRLDDWLDLRLAQAGAFWRVGLGFGDTAAELPIAAGLRAAGRLPDLVLDDWLGLLPAASGVDAEQTELSLDLQIDRLRTLGMTLEDVALALSREPQTWQLALAGERLAGTLTVPVPLDSGRVLVADLQRLHLEPLSAPAETTALEVQPINAQTSSFSPIGLPPLHLFIEDLRWGALNLGRARLESHPVADGMEVELLDVTGPDLRLNGRGRWVDREARIHSELQGRVSTPSLSGLLQSAAYDAGIEASRAQIELDLRWPGAPSDFALGRLSGALDLMISDGSIPEARPGAGRLLGLASFSALPRRLLLDFRDVFATGLKFDQMSGRFDLAAGFARTEGLVIRSPAARITISGDTDMAARQFDQMIVIEPGLGATLPVLGGIAGGPAGAAAGLVLRTILERPLRGIAEARYTVTGPWDEPRIELFEARVTDEGGAEAVLERPR